MPTQKLLRAGLLRHADSLERKTRGEEVSRRRLCTDTQAGRHRERRSAIAAGLGGVQLVAIETPAWPRLHPNVLC